MNRMNKILSLLWYNFLLCIYNPDSLHLTFENWIRYLITEKSLLIVLDIFLNGKRIHVLPISITIIVIISSKWNMHCEFAATFVF